MLILAVTFSDFKLFRNFIPEYSSIMGRKIKNKDIAEKLGLSNTLVSLVLNNKADQQGIRKDTQEKVISLATKLGYFEDLKEQNEPSPVEERPGVIGMIVGSMNDPFIFDISPHLQKAFANIGVGFSVVTNDSDDQRYSRFVNAFKKFYSGLILVGDAADEYTIRTLRAIDYPFVLLEKNIKNLRLNTVSSDNTAGAVLVADHLDKLGYKNLLIVTDDKENVSDSENIDELVEALKMKQNINKPNILKIHKPDVAEGIDFSYFEKYLRPPHRIEVMIVVQAELVYQVIATLQNRKIRIPQDIALISLEEGTGFDLIQSPVTCLRKPVAGMALKVANMLWSEVKNSGKGKFKRQVTMTPELIIRNSC
jgi:DNA-binding LacI/PurR family transcriptional regulator